MPTRTSLQNYPKRGEVFIADLDPSYGYEMHKKRSVLVISDNAVNSTFLTIVILPFTSIVPKVLGPELFKLEADLGFAKESVVALHQIRTVDKIRLIKKIGFISKDKLKELGEALKTILDLS